jgi:uncharacterized protein YjiS (DUF1127 family)
MTEMETAMTDTVVHFSGSATRLGVSVSRAVTARNTHQALNELPDAILKDIGVTRSEIPFVAGALEPRYNLPAPGAGWSVARGAALRLPQSVLRLAIVAAVAVSVFAILSTAVLAQDAHDTGLVKWSTNQIIKAITTGERPNGRILMPIMPWSAIFARLRRSSKVCRRPKTKVRVGPRERAGSLAVKSGRRIQRQLRNSAGKRSLKPRRSLAHGPTRPDHYGRA